MNADLRERLLQERDDLVKRRDNLQAIYAEVDVNFVRKLADIVRFMNGAIQCIDDCLVLF